MTTKQKYSRAHLRTSPTVRFWSKVDMMSASPCWMWTARVDRDGYGHFYAGAGLGKALAHRWSLAQTLGWDALNSPGLEVRHLCGCASCVRPSHLALGTHAENVADTRVHGTLVVGERSMHAKLTESGVRELRHRRSLGESVVELAEDFNVSKSAVLRAVKGESWAHIPGALP